MEREQSMGKIINIEQQGHLFIMKVELEGGHKEKWTYSREEFTDGVSYTMVNKEDA